MKTADWTELARAAGARHGVDPSLILAVIQQESNGNPKALGPKTKSGMRAQGLMQLMPAAVVQVGGTMDKAIHDPASNIEYGTRYLKYLMERFNNDVPTALAAYSHGPTAVQRVLDNAKQTHIGGLTNRLPGETQKYVPAVMAYYTGYKGQEVVAGTGKNGLAGSPQEVFDRFKPTRFSEVYNPPVGGHVHAAPEPTPAPPSEPAPVFENFSFITEPTPDPFGISLAHSFVMPAEAPPPVSVPAPRPVPRVSALENLMAQMAPYTGTASEFDLRPEIQYEQMVKQAIADTVHSALGE